VSGQLGFTLDGNLVEGGIENQTRQTLENIGNILKAAGADFTNGKEFILVSSDEVHDLYCA